MGKINNNSVMQYFTNNFYHPPTKLRDGYVFSRLCLSVILFTRRVSCDEDKVMA